jgi:nitrate/nitrite transporter NarK
MVGIERAVLPLLAGIACDDVQPLIRPSVKQESNAVQPPEPPLLSNSVTDAAPRLGLHENWAQFTLLVLVNAFVGGMVGIERAVLPLLAESEFGLASKTAIISFIISFGIVKALANLFAGRISDRIGRKGVLIAGWVIGMPAPLIIMFAPSWSGWSLPMCCLASTRGYAGQQR